MQYVKICDAYGAGFFYIPGTETCLRVGGLVLAEVAVSNAPYRIGIANPAGAGLVIGGLGVGAGGVGIGLIPGASRDAVAWADLEARPGRGRGAGSRPQGGADQFGALPAAGDDIENLYAVPIDGRTPPVQLTDLTKAFYLNEAAPSPDGRAYAFIGFTYLDRSQRLLVIPNGGGKPVSIDTPVRWFQWVP